MFLLFSIIEKLYPPICSIAFFKPEAIGQGIAIRAKVKQIGRVIFLYLEKNEIPACQGRYTFLLVSRKSYPFFKNCQTCLMRWRKLIRVTKSCFKFRNDNLRVQKFCEINKSRKILYYEQSLETILILDVNGCMGFS